jgi:hypothetical protein
MVKITVNDNGPLRVEGDNITITDMTGRQFGLPWPGLRTALENDPGREQRAMAAPAVGRHQAMRERCSSAPCTGAATPSAQPPVRNP